MLAIIFFIAITNARLVTIPLEYDDNGKVVYFEMLEIGTCYHREVFMSQRVTENANGTLQSNVYHSEDCTGEPNALSMLRTDFSEGETDWVAAQNKENDKNDCPYGKNEKGDVRRIYYGTKCYFTTNMSYNYKVLDGVMYTYFYMNSKNCLGTPQVRTVECGSCEWQTYTLCNSA
ncbi:hypothetical protein QTN25_003962 [Entamoeba marina]